MSEMTRASAVRRAWGAIGNAEKALAAGNFAAAAAGLDLTRAILQFAHVLGEIPPAELHDAAPAPMPMMRPDETVVLPVARQGARTTISVPLRHAFVPGPLDAAYCGYPIGDRMNCALTERHATHLPAPSAFVAGPTARHAFVPGEHHEQHGPAGTWCSVQLEDGDVCGAPPSFSVHTPAVEPFAPGHMPREFP